MLTRDAFSHPVLCRNNPSPNSHFSFTVQGSTGLLSSFRRDWLLGIETFIWCYNTHAHTHTSPFTFMRIALLVLHLISACPYVIRENLCGKNRLHAFQLSFLNECDTDPLCLPSSMPRGIFLWGMTRQTLDKSIHRLDTCFVICDYMEHSVMEECM